MFDWLPEEPPRVVLPPAELELPLGMLEPLVAGAVPTVVFVPEAGVTTRSCSVWQAERASNALPASRAVAKFDFFIKSSSALLSMVGRPQTGRRPPLPFPLTSGNPTWPIGETG